MTKRHLVIPDAAGPYYEVRSGMRNLRRRRTPASIRARDCRIEYISTALYVKGRQNQYRTFTDSIMLMLPFYYFVHTKR